MKCRAPSGSQQAGEGKNTRPVGRPDKSRPKPSKIALFAARELGPPRPISLRLDASEGSQMDNKSEMLNELKRMLNDVLVARNKGATYPRLLRAHGFIDGYMKAMIETGMVSRSELLALVAEERSLVHGAAVAEVRSPDSEVAA
jgi:hypothetical protein